MLFLLFLLFLPLNHVQTCLIVQSGHFIEMNNSKCPPLRFTTKEDIESNKFSSYLANQPIFQKNVYVQDLGYVVIDNANLTTTFFLMIFRDNGPPIFTDRMRPNMDPTKRSTVNGLYCVHQGNDVYKWAYWSGIVENPTITYMSNENACGCGAFPSSTQVGGQCDIVEVTCPNSTDAGYWMSTNMAWNLVLPSLGKSEINDLLCVSGRWFYMGLPLSEVQFWCSAPVSIVDMHTPTPKICPSCADIIVITSDNRYMSVYDMHDVFAEYTLTPVKVDRTQGCESSITCEKADLMVFFSRNYEPMKFSPDSSPYLNCSRSMARPNWIPLGDSTNYWYVDGIMLAEPAVACLSNSSKPDKIDMNGCKCPQIELTDKASVLANPLSAYLANRDIFYPSAVNVTESCEVTVDAPASCDYDDYYFMIFRTNGQPIFNHRFVKELTKDPFNPTGLTCEKIGDSYEWQFYGGKVDNISFALQSNEGMCECSEWQEYSPSVIETEYLYGTCDIIRLKCPEGFTGVDFLQVSLDEMKPTGTMEDFTCVDKSWYINGINTSEVNMRCINGIPFLDDSADTTWPCGCQDLFNNFFSSFPFPVFTSPDQLSNYTTKDIKQTYSPESSFCSPEFECSSSDTLVIFSNSHEPLVYENGTRPNIQCRKTPLALSPDSMSYWYVDGIMLNLVAFGCYAPKSCPCSFEYVDESNIEGLVGTHPFYQNISGHAISAPDDSCVPDDTCPDKVVCPAGLTLVIFDTDSATTFPNGSLASSCSSGGQWSVNGAQFNRLYATCVDYGCPCSFEYMDESNIEGLVGTHPFYQNISSRAISAPDDSCVPDDVCPDKIVCPAGLTLVIFDTDSATTFPNGSLSSSCSASKWSVNGAEFNRLYATCVDYGCSCSFKYLDESNIQNVVLTHPFYQNVSEHTISAPDDNCVPDDVCPDKIVCPAGFTLVIFDTDTATTFPNGSLASTCSGATWSVNGAQFTRLYATCVDYGCPCSFEYMDESNIEGLVGNHPFYQNISHLTISAPNDNCVSEDVCPESVTCPTGLTLVIFGSDIALSFPSQVPTTCSNITKHWNVYNTVIDRLYVTCVDFVMNGCKCAPIKQLNSTLIGANSNWAELKNEQIWDTQLTYNGQCEVREKCDAQVDSFYTAFVYTDGLPIIMSRKTGGNASGDPELIQGLSCVQTDNAYQWQLYGYPLQDPSITCVADMNSCQCPVISGSDKLGEVAIIISTIEGYCGAFEASCPSGGVPKLVTDNLNPISPQGRPIFDDLRCVTGDDGGHQWKFGNLDLINPAISCPKQCACGELLAIIGKTDLSVYDPTGHFSSYQITPGTWSYQNCAASLNLTCPTDYEPFVFGNGIDYVQVTTKLISCVDNPAGSDMKMWMAEGRRVLDPAVACLKKP